MMICQMHGLSDAEKAAAFYGTAARVYSLETEA